MTRTETTLCFEHALLPQGMVSDCRLVVDDKGRIAAVEEAEGGPYDGGLAVPGMANAHSHCFQRALCGVGEASGGMDTFWGWRETMYRLAAAITPDDLYAVAQRAFSDMLLAGFTSVGEFHYLHHLPDGTPGPEMADAVIAAAKDTGIRLVLLPVYYRTGGFDEVARPEQARFVHRSVDAFAALVGDIRGVPLGIAPHSLRAVPLADLAGLLQLADAVGGEHCPLHIHIAEQQAELARCREIHGTTPVDLLARHVDLSSRWNLVHATHASGAELNRVASSRARIIVCPLTEAYLGDGIFDATGFSTRGGELAIGSDANARIDAVEEMRLLEYTQRLRDQRRARLADASGLGDGLWARLARGGAAALALQGGELRAGCRADITVIDLRSTPLATTPRDRLMDTLVVGGGRENIESVYVGGVRRMHRGRVANQAAMERDYAAAIRRLARAGETS